MSRSDHDWLKSNTPPTPVAEELAATEEPDSEEPVPRVCSQCESPLDADQLYCLECGAPTDIAPRITPPTKFGALIVAGLIGLGLVGGGVAFAVLQDGDSESDETGSAVTSVDTTAGDIATEVPTTTDGGLPPDPAAPTTNDDGVFEDPATQEPAGTDVAPTDVATSAWPAGTSAWTVFLSSVTDGAAALDAQQRAEAAGVEAGLLYSSDHEGLNPGYWVVYSGIFDTRAEAVNHADDLRPVSPGGANARFVAA
jgi:hypothetical protein